MVRLLIMAVMVIGVALAAPRFAPPILASWLHASTPGEAGAAAPAPTPEGQMQVARAAGPVPQQPLRGHNGHRFTIAADGGGHFFVDARVNGRQIRAMIDTGATTVSLNEATARGLGIFPRRDQYTQPVSTANGIVNAAEIILPEIRIGPIVVRNVPAIVVPGDDLTVNLVGMSYLQRLTRFESSGNALVLVE
jgi:aspartyl protease family protein